METTYKFKVIDRDTLKSKLDRGEKFHLWNVLSDEYYKSEQSIPGSRHVPGDKLEQLLPSLGVAKNDDIVVYCGSFQCTASKAAAEKLVQAGYTKVSAYEGGIKDWWEGKQAENQGGCSSCS